MAVNNEIPCDLHPVILERLPSQSLINFLTVDKSWYSLITNPKFIASHLHHHKSLSLHRPNHPLLLRKGYSKYDLFRYGNPSSRRTVIPNPPKGFDTVAATCDGVVCMSDSTHQNLLLWNPSMYKTRKIKPSPVLHNSKSVAVAGLGYNSLGNNYKLVLINYEEMNVWTPPEILHSAHVYSFNGGGGGGEGSPDWKRVSLPDTFPFNNNLTRISESCFVNDMIHWIVFRGRVDPMNNDGMGFEEVDSSILTFDPKHDCFGEIKLPRELAEAVSPELHLAVIGESIVVVHIYKDRAAIWRMEEYGVQESWKVLYRIKLSSVTNKQVWAKEDGKVYIITSSGKLIVLFNVNKSSGSSGVFVGAVGMIGGKVFGCTESLVMFR
ncbi:F-box protein At4g22390-like [Spinacia oleracea]|uniref:F-box protein At4g22390-like n=1 Tax=Spinacia oleracea TaxID=3562 RepID=A0ABM3R4C4_SPIOL|nr:F-box protein At4g22390-like [Spinacia oleracea]